MYKKPSNKARAYQTAKVKAFNSGARTITTHDLCALVLEWPVSSIRSTKRNAIKGEGFEATYEHSLIKDIAVLVRYRKAKAGLFRDVYEACSIQIIYAGELLYQVQNPCVSIPSDTDWTEELPNELFKVKATTYLSALVREWKRNAALAE